MRVAALISGGKDSTFNIMQCMAAGHEIVALGNLVPHTRSEIDSYMYQSVGHEAIDLIAEALDLPLFKQETFGRSIQQGKTYEPSKDDEVEDLYELLKKIKEEIAFDAVSVGAILSDYQRIRVENVCIRLDLVPLAYLWRRNQADLLDEMIKCEVDAIIIKVAALGLEPNKHLGRTLSQMQPHLGAMHEKYGLHVCGEGGEYETLTLDCPLFKSRIVVNKSEIVLHSDDPIAAVGYLKFNEIYLEVKLPPLDLDDRLKGLPLKDSDGYITDQGEEALNLNEEQDDEDVEVEIIENDTESSVKPSTIEKSCINQSATSVKSVDGWLWIGGVHVTARADPYTSMIEAMCILQSILSEHDHSLTDLCSITMFISDMGEYRDLNRAYIEMLNHNNPPTRACVQVPFDPTCPIVMEALSWKPSVNNSGDLPLERYTMHVQSRSHWAPANIGPYSQLVRIGDVIQLAGQIGLVPGSLEMVNGGIKSQCQLALRNIGRLLNAIDSNLRDVVQGICYVTDLSYVEPARKIWESKTNNAIVEYVVVEGLPRNALVEWHVWAHRHNHQFEYEETGKCVEKYSISIYRRWNYENNIATIVCHVDCPETEQDGSELNVFTEAMEYTLRKLQQGHENDASSVYSLKVFYSLVNGIDPEMLKAHLDCLRERFLLVYTLVPVIYLKHKHTLLSVCGVRFQ